MQSPVPAHRLYSRSPARSNHVAPRRVELSNTDSLPNDLSKMSLKEFLARTPLLQLVTLVGAILGAGYWFGIKNVENTLQIQKSEILQQRTADPNDLKRILEEVLAIKKQVATISSTPMPGRATPQASEVRSISPSTDPTLTSSCKILETGNDLYQQNKLEDALSAYLAIEAVDKLGREQCTPAIYATIGTVYLLLANRVSSANQSQASTYLRRAALYNRAFAIAVACNRGDCNQSQVFWKDGGGIWSN